MACDDKKGSGDHRHDPERMLAMAKVMLRVFASACNEEDVCEFHAGLMLLAAMNGAMINTVEKNEGDPRSLKMAYRMIRTLESMIIALEKETDKWQKPMH